MGLLLPVEGLGDSDIAGWFGVPAGDLPGGLWRGPRAVVTDNAKNYTGLISPPTSTTSNTAGSGHADPKPW